MLNNRVQALSSLFLVFSVIVSSGYSEKLPSFIKQCSRSDPGLTKCLTDATQNAVKFLDKGLPELNLPPLDPLKIGKIEVDQPSLNVQFDESYIYGLKECRVHELRIDTDNKKIHLNYTKDGGFMGKYKVNGQILIIPIRGDGDCKIKFTNLNYYFIMDYNEQMGKDGKQHWKITKHQANYGAEKIVFKFTNLFGGNKQLSDTAHRVVNDNAQLIFNDISPPIMSKVTRLIANYVGKFLEAVPIDDMFLP